MKPGEPVELAFSAKPGYQFLGATGTCDMIVDENIVRVESVDFDCRVEPSYEQQEGSSDIFRFSLEEPVKDNVYAGVGNLRGWAVATAGIEKIEIWIDGAYEFDAPMGERETISQLHSRRLKAPERQGFPWPGTMAIWIPVYTQ